MDRSPLIPGVAAALMAVGSALFLAMLWSEPLVGAPRVPAVDGDPRAHPTGSSCSGPVWPYYDAQCLRDLRRPGGRARAVRVVMPGSAGSHIRDMK